MSSFKDVVPAAQKLKLIRKKLDTSPREALHLSLEIVEEALEKEKPLLQAEGRLNAGWAYNYLSQPTSAMTEFLRALQIFNANKRFDGAAKTLHGMGTLHHRMGDIEIAINYYMQVLELSRQHHNHEWEFTAYNRLGELNLDLGKIDQASELFHSAEILLEKKSTTSQRILLNINQATILIVIKKTQEALDFLSKVLKDMVANEDKRGESRVLHLMGRGYSDIELYDESLAYYSKALDIMAPLENLSGQVLVYIEETLVYQKTGDVLHASETCEKAYQLSKEYGLRIEEAKSSRLLAEIYEQQGEYKKGIELLKRYVFLSEHINSETITRRLANFKLQYQLQSAEKESRELHQKNAHLEKQTESLKSLNERISYINEVAQELVETLDKEELSRRFSLILHSLIPLSSIGFSIYNLSENCLEFFYWELAGKSRTPMRFTFSPEKNLPSQVFNTGTELILDWNPDKPSVLSKGGARHIWVFPLGEEKNISGVAVLESSEEKGFTSSSIPFIKTLIKYYSGSFHNSLKHSEILRLNEVIRKEKGEIEESGKIAEYMAHHDSLTGAVNRLMMSALIENAINQCTRRKEYFSIVYIDLDSFKEVNDSLGHAAGDEVLKSVVHHIQTAIRETDILARIGGDEMVVLLHPVTSRLAATKVAEKILQAISLPMDILDKTYRLTASIGVSMFPEDGRNQDELLGSADKAMYDVKHMTKNGIKSA